MNLLAAPTNRDKFPHRPRATEAPIAAFERKLAIGHADGAIYGKAGIRDRFVYRHFGVAEATGGKHGAHRMLRAADAARGIVTAPHGLAASAGLSVLREGGNAIEAMIAAAATIAVVYPHMNGLGGDGFWLIAAPGAEPVGIDGCGATGRGVAPSLYRGASAIPARGPLAANTVAGTVSGWREALALSAEWGGGMTLARLFEDAVHYADEGFPASDNQAYATALKAAELVGVPGFAETFLIDGAPPAPGARFRNPALARTLRRLAADGLDGFYRGALARSIDGALAAAGAPLTRADLAAHRARRVAPLALALRSGTVYNMPPPTQGVASLMILGLVERLGIEDAAPDGFAHVHAVVEATKQAFLLRDAHLADPDTMDADPADWLTPRFLDSRARRIDRARALPWPRAAPGGDTVWLGAIDGAGRAVSFIQSLYWEFGSGVVLPETGLVWQNRGTGMRLSGTGPNRLAPSRRPFHTLNPALARLADGSVMAYGTMGGEGQPQTQAALHSRIVTFGQDCQAAVSAPRWLLGRTWGEETSSLKIEPRFDPAVLYALAAAGHDVEPVAPYSDLMGHAGAVIRRPDGRLEGAADPRGNGAVAGF